MPDLKFAIKPHISLLYTQIYIKITIFFKPIMDFQHTFLTNKTILNH